MLIFVQVCTGDEAFQNKQRLESFTWTLYKYEPTPDNDNVNKPTPDNDNVNKKDEL